MLRLRQIVCIVSLALFATTTVGCATTDKSKARRTEKVSSLKKKRSGPANYSLFSPRDIDRKLLKRGQRQMHGGALDSY